MQTSDHLNLHEFIPDRGEMIRCLAVTPTQATFLFSELRASERPARKGKRLRLHRPEEVQNDG